VLFLVVPIVELFVLIRVGGAIGVGNTILTVLLVSVVGAWLVKREGLKTLRRIQEQLNNATLPADDVIDGGLIMFAGALMLTPGFVTDLVAIALLIPPVRSTVRRSLKKRFGHKFSVATATTAGSGGFGAGSGSIFGNPFPPQYGGPGRTGDVIDVDSEVEG
jgi:UPF0716 protein FxsA